MNYLHLYHCNCLSKKSAFNIYIYISDIDGNACTEMPEIYFLQAMEAETTYKACVVEANQRQKDLLKVKVSRNVLCNLENDFKQAQKCNCCFIAMYVILYTLKKY